MVRNMTLYRRGTLLGLPAVCLQRPFDKEKQLPELRKRLLSKKEIADLVEAILGAAWEAAARDAVGLTPGQPLADGALNTLITSSLPFSSSILPPEKSIGSPSFDELVALACKEQIDEWNAAQPTAPGSPAPPSGCSAATSSATRGYARRRGLEQSASLPAPRVLRRQVPRRRHLVRAPRAPRRAAVEALDDRRHPGGAAKAAAAPRRQARPAAQRARWQRASRVAPRPPLPSDGRRRARLLP